LELRACLADVTAGHGHLFLLSGEPGIGKTRLADEFGRFTVAQGIRVAWGRCWEGGGAPAYWPWIQVVRACLMETDTEQRAAILGSEATPRVGQDIAQLLPELRTTHAPTPRPLGLQPTDPGQARFQLFESVTTVLKNVASIGPLVIVIDDLHDTDHPSLLLLKIIAGQSKEARILLVGSYRDTEVRQSQELTRLIGELSREGHSIPIVGLSEAEVGEFLTSRSGKKADEKLVANLYQATDGNPLFVDGVVRLLVAEGKLERALAGDSFKIPDGVQESIRRRLVKLPERTNRLLSIASVIGNQVETQVLAQVSGDGAVELVEGMEGALRAGIAVDYGGASHYRFSHALVREALYQDLPTTRRIQLHAEIGAAIEEVHKDDLKPHLAALAHHFTAAGDARKAIDYSIAAADDAEAVFAYEDAISHLHPALAIAESHDHDGAQRAALLLRLGRIVVFKNQELGVPYLEGALRLFEQIGDNQHAGEAHYYLAHLHMNMTAQFDVRRSLIHLQRAEALLGETSERRSLGLLHKDFAWTSFNAMRVSEAFAISQKAMEIFALLGDRQSWASVACGQVHYLMVKGKLARARALIDEVGWVAASFANPDAFREVNYMCGWFWSLMRNPREAMRYFRLGLKRPGHDSGLQSSLLQFLALNQAVAGNIAEAKRFAAENFVNPLFRMQIAYYEGDWKVAAQAGEEALDWARSGGSKWNELHALIYRMDLRRVTGDYPGAIADQQRALSLYQPDDLYFEVRLRPRAALLYSDAGEPAKAVEHLEYCRQIIPGGEDWISGVGYFWRSEAIVAALQNGFEESDRHFEKSIEIFKQYSLPWEEAETLYYWGKVLLQTGRQDQAREKLDAAIKIYRDYGAGQSWIDRVEADRRRAQPPSAGPRLPSVLHGAETASGEAVFRKEDDFWKISYLERSFRLKDMRGLHYIACLLAHPNERFHVRELSANDGDASSPATSDASLHADQEDAPPILDSKAKATYRARLSELRADLEEAERINDRGRAERIRQELEFVNDELSAAVGLSGRDRKMSDSAERARKRIGKAIRSALSGIREHDPSLAHHLTTSIRTGYYCAYFSDPQQLLSCKL
jgi:tetratricopeptide (TPR) repeat protein